MFTKVLNRGTYYFVMMLACALFLAGCKTISTSQKNPFQYPTTKASSYYLQRADTVRGSEETDWRLQAIQVLIREKNFNEAEKQIKKLPEKLKRAQQRELALLKVELQIQQDKFDDAAKQSDKLNKRYYSGAQKDRYYQAKIAVAKGTKKPVSDIVNLYIQWEKESSPFQQKNIVNETWTLFKSLSEQERASLKSDAKDFELRGWLDLLAIYQDQLESFGDKITAWSKQYKNHPAARFIVKNVPGDSGNLPITSDWRNTKVALLLPLSGNTKVLGEAIQSGFNDALKQASNDDINVTVYDTASRSLDDIINTVKADGTTFIVGPLMKNLVAEIRKKPLSLPVLTLNRVDNVYQRSNVCFFTLAPEDEAVSAVKLMYSQGKRNPLIIAPKNEFGQRVATAFAQQWQKMSGNNDARVYYFDSYAQLKTMIKQGFSLTGDAIPLTNTAIKPSQNSDIQEGSEALLSDVAAQTDSAIDSIYILATQQELMLIKPMIDVKTNAMKRRNIALYASSRSNSAGSSRDFYSEMDGIQFSDMPIIATKNAELLQQLPEFIRKDNSLIRLYAMGFDAWTLMQDYPLLNRDYQKQGMTGSLSVDNQCVIYRDLMWQQFRQGGIQLLPQNPAQ